MKIFFDTEFTGLHKNTTLISMGLVSQYDDLFYFELVDYDKSQVDDWIEKNVIQNLLYNDREVFIVKSGNNYKGKGTKEDLKKYLFEWLKSFNSDIQLVSDVCHYDFVLFIDIFGNAFNLPKFVSSYCHDINQDIANFLNVSEKKAFNINREEFVLKFRGKIELSIQKHNALFDAKIIKYCYEIIHY